VIEEPLRNGSHDDVCNVVVGAAVTMAEMLARQPQLCPGGFCVVTGPRFGAFGGNAEDLDYAAARSTAAARVDWYGERRS
jgi:hypothetical protein